MLRTLRNWLKTRREKKQTKYAEEYGWMDADELERLREQQSPLRGRGSVRR
jgi:hypothetical protein